MEISIVLGTLNRKRFLKKTIANLRNELKNNTYEIIVVDGGSLDGTLQWLTKQKDIITIIQHNNGTWKGEKIKRQSWGYFMNLAFKIAKYDLICMVSDDCLLEPNSIINAIELYFSHAAEKIGGVAFYWRNWPIEKRFYVGITLGNNIMINHGIFNKKALQEIDYIDEKNYLFYKADDDLSLKLVNAGYHIIDSPNSIVEHFSHFSFITKHIARNNAFSDVQNLFKKWKGIFHYDDSDIYTYQKKLKFLDSNIQPTISKEYKLLFLFYGYPFLKLHFIKHKLILPTINYLRNNHTK